VFCGGDSFLRAFAAATCFSQCFCMDLQDFATFATLATSASRLTSDNPLYVLQSTTHYASYNRHPLCSKDFAISSMQKYYNSLIALIAKVFRMGPNAIACTHRHWDALTIQQRDSCVPSVVNTHTR
jgi:hypothetical protein